MISDALALINLLQSQWKKYSVISALFNFEGLRVEGDRNIQVDRINVTNSKDKWYFRIKDLDGYVFVYMPLIPTVFVDYGILSNNINPNAKVFRFVGNIFSPVISGGNPNVLVDFIVVGYKPKDLLNIKEKS